MFALRKLRQFRTSSPVGLMGSIVLTAVGALLAVVVARSFASPRLAAQARTSTPDPWTPAQLVEPAELAKELADRSAPTHPTVVYVGFAAPYRAGHVPGASSHGPASSAAGLADLKHWAEGVPKSSDIVIYCGCCPMDVCPNVRPAFTALHEMGFTHLRVLRLPQNFGADWVDKGFPIER